MVLSVRTNQQQLTALRVLGAADRRLAEAQERLATGLKVASPKDNAAVYAIAQNERALKGAYNALGDARNRTLALLDVTLAAVDSISDVLMRMKALAVAAVDPSLGVDARQALAADFEAAKKQIDSAARNATFLGANLLDSSGSNFLQYGPRALPPAQPAIRWGTPLGAVGEPQAGDPLDLHFGFRGAGAQNETISGNVVYRLRYHDAGAWTVVPLATHPIPVGTPPTVGPALPAYDAEAAATMPAVPATATEVQIYAEYTGAYPNPGGEPIQEVIANGAPDGHDFAERVPHLLARWIPGGAGVTVYRDMRQREITTKIEVLNGVDGANIPIREKDTTTGGLAGLFLQEASLADEAAARNALGLVDRARHRLVGQAHHYAALSRSFGTMKAVEGKVADELTAGIGKLVDADMAKEAARLQAGQAKRALSVQALSIANEFPNILLRLFR